MSTDPRSGGHPHGGSAQTREAALPVIDVGDFETSAAARASIVQAVTCALTDVGFMYVRGHGLDGSLVAEAFAASRTFFTAPRAVKDHCAYTDVDLNFGYQSLEVESLDPAAAPDLKESFTMRNALAMDATAHHWPSAHFRDIALRFFAASFAAGKRILAVLAACLELPQDFFAARHRGENVTLRFLHYPRNLPVRSAAQLGAGAHTDYGSITLLLQDDVGGLEVLDGEGRWQPAPRLDGALLINTGDLMERWTNGRFRSTRHRVQPLLGPDDRYSIALFVDPDPEVEIVCIPSCSDGQPRHPPITAREHIRQKIAATHSILK